MTVDDPRVKNKIEEMCRVLAETGDSELLESFFYCLLTPAEIADVASRWALVKDLREGKTQREIAKDLGVSLCKITRGSRELKKESSAFQRVYKILDNLNAERGSEEMTPYPLHPDHDDRQ